MLKKDNEAVVVLIYLPLDVEVELVRRTARALISYSIQCPTSLGKKLQLGWPGKTRSQKLRVLV